MNDIDVRRADEVRILLLFLVTDAIRHDGLDLVDQHVARHAQPLRRHHRHLTPLHRPDPQVEGAVADRGDERERRHGEASSREREAAPEIIHSRAPASGS
jgi:hypothetical protein